MTIERTTSGVELIQRPTIPAPTKQALTAQALTAQALTAQELTAPRSSAQHSPPENHLLSLSIAFQTERSTAPGAFGRRLRGAERELERLHVEELARLLARASELRTQAGACAAPASSAAATHMLGERGVAAWRVALADEFAAGAADGAVLSPALAALLACCGSPAVTDWPSASQLAGAAVALSPDARTRLALGRAWLGEGDVERAVEVFASALREAVGRRTEQAVLEALREARACG